MNAATAKIIDPIWEYIFMKGTAGVTLRIHPTANRVLLDDPEFQRSAAYSGARLWGLPVLVDAMLPSGTWRLVTETVLLEGWV